MCHLRKRKQHSPYSNSRHQHLHVSKKIVEKNHVDIFLVLAFSQFLKEEILSLPKIGPFNIHTSLLPKYRGAAPVQYAIWNGDQTTGVSIQKMVKKMDAGDIAYSHKVPIEPKDTSKTLFEKLTLECRDAINNFLPQLLKGKIIYRPQSESLVSFAPSLKKEDGLLKFTEKSAEQILNQIRAMDPWPGTFTWLNDMRLKVLKATRENFSLKPGELSTNEGFLLVGTKQDTLRLTQVQLEGKKVCFDTELLNGLKNKTTTFILNTP